MSDTDKWPENLADIAYSARVGYNWFPFTEVGVIAPSVNVIAGVVDGFATVPEIPFAVTTDTFVTVPGPPSPCPT